MTYTAPSPGTLDAPSAPSATDRITAMIGARDPRLDFFRGIAMFIILIAHTPLNLWTLYIPARFGWSDATEMFVFCSGMASAIAFGKAFSQRGMALGSLRVGYRIWQVYWAHVGLFFAILATLSAIDLTGAFERVYHGQLGLQPFFENPQAAVVGILTLTYVPNYFDILPMYIGALALMPVIVALARVHVAAAFALMGALWLAAQFQLLQFSARPWDSEIEWFFNPFGWQLLFFTGFAFMAGWLPAPPVTRRLVTIAIAIVAVSFVLKFNWWRTFPHPEENELTTVQSWLYALHLQTFYFREDVRFLFWKTDFGLFRYVHFLALAYLAWAAVGPRGQRILPRSDGPLARVWAVILTAILKVGQQSLAVFVFSMWYARLQGLMLDVIGREALTFLLVNVSGFCVLVGVAYLAAYIKSSPWKAPRSTA